MKPPIKNNLALELSQEQKATLCQRVSQSSLNGREKVVQTDKKTTTNMFVFIIVDIIPLTPPFDLIDTIIYLYSK